VPGIVARGPFLIGFQERREGGDVQTEAVIHVDLDDPRISATDGEPVFLPQGGNSRYLDRVVGILNGIRTGLEVSKAMFAAFTAADLIESVKIEVNSVQKSSTTCTGCTRSTRRSWPSSMLKTFTSSIGPGSCRARSW
jgi:hypothetical protein